MFASDAATFLQDFGSPASWSPSAGGATVSDLVLFDQPSEVLEGGTSISRQYLARLVTATWPGLKRNEVLVIGGEGGGASYRLRTDLRAEDDGVFSVADLTKV
jgi:hypothetical protein